MVFFDVQFSLFHEFDHYIFVLIFFFLKHMFKSIYKFFVHFCQLWLEQILNPSLLFRIFLEKDFFIFNMCLKKLKQQNMWSCMIFKLPPFLNKCLNKVCFA